MSDENDFFNISYDTGDGCSDSPEKWKNMPGDECKKRTCKGVYRIECRKGGLMALTCNKCGNSVWPNP
eukprot:g7474.t1